MIKQKPIFNLIDCVVNLLFVDETLWIYQFGQVSACEK